MPDTTPLHTHIRQLLLQEWDPTNASRSEHAHTAYDSLIDPLISLIQSGQTEESIIDFLLERQSEMTCFPGLDRGPLRRVARMLVAAVKSSA